jgi:hypothetical protein
MPTRATWHPTPQRRPERAYATTVTILDIRKKTARIEVVRGDGRRFVKLARLRMEER